KKFTEIVLSKYNPKKLIIFSRDELKQFEMAKQFDGPNIRYFIAPTRGEDPSPNPLPPGEGERLHCPTKGGLGGGVS
ncbi:hypothetical protein HX99_02170, partial [Peptococcaceae bacterium SCADC1_2_3]